MIVFVDTSALYAVFDRNDQEHATALEAWNGLLDQDADLVTHNYVLLETSALVQHRLGLGAVRSLHLDVVPRMTVAWISEEEHALGVEAILTASRKGLSLADCISFRTMRRMAIGTAFSFDRHFREQGFTVVP